MFFLDYDGIFGMDNLGNVVNFALKYKAKNYQLVQNIKFMIKLYLIRIENLEDLIYLEEFDEHLKHLKDTCGACHELLPS